MDWFCDDCLNFQELPGPCVLCGEETALLPELTDEERAYMNKTLGPPEVFGERPVTDPTTFAN